MTNLDNCNHLWYLLNNFFYKHHCHNGFIGHDKDYYAFQKKEIVVYIRRKNNDYLITYYTKHTVKTKELTNVSIKQLEKVLEEIINEN